ncbi:MAG TPA: ABC-2 family transporter protein [Vicinamibacterales bacterium]|jgi:ABC-2 type transport system permease protein|nr:ABC-2 family transporter protein [Vicinamibacterales bacterium]
MTRARFLREPVKYAAFVVIAVANGRRDRTELYGRMAFFVVILGVFSSLWRATREAGLMIASDPKSLVWYLASTEWILLSAPLIHVDVQEAIRRGDIACDLGRPVSYVGATFAQGLGSVASRAPLLGVTAFLCAFAFTGWVPQWRGLAAVVVFGSLATALLTLLHILIGLVAFWIGDATPVFWVWQKLLFVFGGLMLPIRLYPSTMQRVAAFTPFPDILAGPASFVLEGESVAPGVLAARLAMWCVVTMVTVQWLWARACRALAVNGG